MLDEQLRALGLIGGGECFAHFHQIPVSLDMLHRMQQLEVVVYTETDYTCREQDDFIFVGSVAGPVTVTLHPARYGQQIVVSRIKGTNPVTVATVPGETVNLAPSVTITESFKPLRLKAIYANPNATATRQHHVNPVDNFIDKGYLEI